jgi:ABC-2 type transport system permease protein
MWRRIYTMLAKEFLELRRDPMSIFVLFLPLLLQTIVFGYAATFTVNNVATAVLDLDRSETSRGLISRFVATGRFRLVDVADRQEEITRDLNKGSATVAIVIHAGFERALGDGRTAPLQVLVDGTNSNTALISLGYVSQIVARFQAEETSRAWPARAGAAPAAVSVSLQQRPWFNPGLEDRWFFIPGIIGTLTLVQIVNLTSFAIVREREVGTLEQIMVTPIRPFEFIMGKTAPFFLIGLADVVFVTLIGVLWFGVPFVGDPLVMFVGVSLFLLASLGLGLLLSTFSRTQQQAFALNFFLVNPLFILSGFAYPIGSMPEVLQWATVLNPLRYFLVFVRAVFLKGVGLGVLWPEASALALLAASMLAFSVLRFRKSLD